MRIKRTIEITITILLVSMMILLNTLNVSAQDDANDVAIWSDNFDDGVLDSAWTADGWSGNTPDTINDADEWAEQNGVLDISSDMAGYGVAKIYREIDITQDGTYYYKGEFYTEDQGCWASTYFGFKISNITWPYPSIFLSNRDDSTTNNPWVRLYNVSDYVKRTDDTWYKFRLEIDISEGKLVSYRSYLMNESGDTIDWGSKDGEWDVPDQIWWCTDDSDLDMTGTHRQRAYFDNVEYGEGTLSNAPTGNVDDPTKSNWWLWLVVGIAVFAVLAGGAGYLVYRRR